MRLARRRLGHLFGGPSPGEAKGGQGLRPRPLPARLPGQRAAAAQGVQHKARDPGAVLGPGVAGAVTPALQRLAHGLVALLDL